MTPRAAWRQPGGRIGLVLLALLLLLVVVGPWFLPPPYLQPDPEYGRHLPPGPGHPLGTDDLSRDVLSRVVSGGRVSLAVAAGAVALSVTLGTLVGLVAGYAGGWVDLALMRLVDGALAVPRLFLLLIMVGIMERIPLGVLILTIGATGWFGTSRLVRAEVLRLRTLGFVQGAESLGARRIRVLLRHLLPNVVGPLAAATTLAVGDVILLEAGLSYLGFGVQPPTPSWGGMIFGARSALTEAPWVGIAPGLAIVLTVMAVQLLGDALQQFRLEARP